MTERDQLIASLKRCGINFAKGGDIILFGGNTLIFDDDENFLGMLDDISNYIERKQARNEPKPEPEKTCYLCYEPKENTCHICGRSICPGHGHEHKGEFNCCHCENKELNIDRVALLKKLVTPEG